MTPDDLAAIRARDARARLGTAGRKPGADVQAREDRRALLAQVDRLTALVGLTEWQSEVNEAAGHYSHACGVEDERARIRAAVEGMDFVVPRLCSCHAGEMRRAQEPDEYRAAVLAAIDGDMA